MTAPSDVPDDADLRHRLGSRVRGLRGQRGWTQDQLAARTGLHRTYIGSIERGERNVALVNLVKVADAFELTVSELLAEL